MRYGQNGKIEHLKKLSRLLDSKFEGPYGLKFGLDGLLGLIPGVGDFITTSLSLYIVLQAALMGCSVATVFRMALNILIENLIDIIPLLGNLFDFFWKSNTRNMVILENHLRNPSRVNVQSRILVAFVALVSLCILTLSAYFTYWIITSIISLFK